MKNIQIKAKDFIDLPHIIMAEIEDDEDRPWWWPKSDVHSIFEQAHLKFVNGNLNYVHLENMIAHAIHRTPKLNPSFRKTSILASMLKARLEGRTGEELGPFGRMCIWKLPPGHRIEPHTDNYRYHKHVRRWLYFLNLNQAETEVIFDGQTMYSDPGDIVELAPATQEHTLVNHADRPWYFFVFDTWSKTSLKPLVSTYRVKGTEDLSYLSEH